MDKRFKDYRFWTAIFSLIALICQGYNLRILPENYDQIVSVILGALIVSGIITTYPDKKDDE